METMDAVDKHRWVLEALDQHETALLRFASRLLGDEDAARDAVQHAFLRLCGQSPETMGTRVGPWLFAVCRHYAIDLLRKRKNMATNNETEPSDCCDHEPGPADVAEQAELYQCVSRLVNQLAIHQREAVSLWSEGFSYRQIAEMTQATEGNVRVIVHRALQQLRRHPAVQQLLSLSGEIQPLRVAVGESEGRS